MESYDASAIKTAIKSFTSASREDMLASLVLALYSGNFQSALVILHHVDPESVLHESLMHDAVESLAALSGNESPQEGVLGQALHVLSRYVLNHVHMEYGTEAVEDMFESSDPDSDNILPLWDIVNAAVVIQDSI